MAETATAADLGQSFDQAFDDAVKQASQPQSESSDTETQASETETAQTEQPPAEATQAEEESAEPLLSAEEQKLTGEAREKALNRAWTQKTQNLAEQRKQLEALQPLLEALQQDPKAAVTQLAQELGLEITPATGAEPAKVQEVTEEINAELTALLGPELGKSLGSIIEKAATRIAAKAIEPVKSLSERQQLEAEVARSDAAIEQLKAKYPDAPKFDKKMAELSKMIHPVEGAMNAYQYLEMLYHLATRDISKAEARKEAIKAIEKSARSSESSTSAASSSQIKPAPPDAIKGASLDKAIDLAYAAAKRGERWE